MPNFVELQFFTRFSKFFRIINIYQFFFTLNALVDEADSGLKHGKKTFRSLPFIYF